MIIYSKKKSKSHFFRTFSESAESECLSHGTFQSEERFFGAGKAWSLANRDVCKSRRNPVKVKSIFKSYSFKWGIRVWHKGISVWGLAKTYLGREEDGKLKSLKYEV